MLQRWLDGLAAAVRNTKVPSDKTEIEKSYYDLYTWLIDECYRNIFTGANSCRMSTVLSILMSCQELMSVSKVQHSCFKQLYHVKYWEKIMVCLSNSYEDNKIIGYKLAAGFDVSQLKFDVSESGR